MEYIPINADCERERTTDVKIEHRVSPRRKGEQARINYILVVGFEDLNPGHKFREAHISNGSKD